MFAAPEASCPVGCNPKCDPVLLVTPCSPLLTLAPLRSTSTWWAQRRVQSTSAAKPTPPSTSPLTCECTALTPTGRPGQGARMMSRLGRLLASQAYTFAPAERLTGMALLKHRVHLHRAHLQIAPHWYSPAGRTRSPCTLSSGTTSTTASSSLPQLTGQCCALHIHTPVMDVIRIRMREPGGAYDPPLTHSHPARMHTGGADPFSAFPPPARRSVRLWDSAQPRKPVMS